MILKDLYKKDITRDVNPAVSAGDLKESTVRTEIEEYVFTQEIIQGLYDVISGIRDASASHNGIWISGYYGSVSLTSSSISITASKPSMASVPSSVSQKKSRRHPTNSAMSLLQRLPTCASGFRLLI